MAQEVNVVGIGLLGGFCLLSGLAFGAYRAGSGDGKALKRQAAKQAHEMHKKAIQEAQQTEIERAKKLEAQVNALELETKDLTDRVAMIERKHPVLKKPLGPYDLELLRDKTVPLADVVQRTFKGRLAEAGQGRKVEVAKIKGGFAVTLELDRPLDAKMVNDVRLAFADLIQHTPKVWVQDLRITGPKDGRPVSLGPLEKLSPVAIGDAVDALVGTGIKLPGMKGGRSVKPQIRFTGGRYPGLVHAFGPQGKNPTCVSGVIKSNPTITLREPGAYYVTVNTGGVVWGGMVSLSKLSYGFNASALKFPPGRRPTIGIVRPTRRTSTYRRRTVYPPGYRNRRPVYRSRRTFRPTPRPTYRPPGTRTRSRYRSRTTPTPRRTSRTRRRYR